MSDPGDATGSGALNADRLTEMIENNSSAFFRLDRDWIFTYVNAQAELFLGRDRSELIGRTLWDRYPDPELASWVMVALYDEDGTLYEAAAHHEDHARLPDIRRLEQLHPRLVSDWEIIELATSTGLPQQMAGMSEVVRAQAEAGD